MKDNTREDEDVITRLLLDLGFDDDPNVASWCGRPFQIKQKIRTTFHQELQKAREEERERIEAIFKEHVPPHAMDLEDSVWLKRLLNKAFNHDKNI